MQSSATAAQQVQHELDGIVNDFTHDLKSSLAVVALCAHVLRSELTERPELNEYIDAILDETRHCVERLRTFGDSVDLQGKAGETA